MIEQRKLHVENLSTRSQINHKGKELPVLVSRFNIDFAGEADCWDDFIDRLTNDTSRNEKIVQCAANRSKADKAVIVLTVTVRHAEMLAETAKRKGLNALLIHGQLPAKTRAERIRQAPGARLIIGTPSLFNEGVNWPRLGVLIFAAPMSETIGKAAPESTKLIQSIGLCRCPYPGQQFTLVLDIVDGCRFGRIAWHERRLAYERYDFTVV